MSTANSHPTTVEANNHADVEYAPLVDNPDVVPPQTGAIDELYSMPEGRKGDRVAQLVTFASVGVFVAATWIIVFTNDPWALGWFFWHPILQSLSIATITYGILTLQPTAYPTTKAAGLARHQTVILAIGIPAIAVGTASMWTNKHVHGAPHATTWHATFGYIAVSWMAVQVIAGAGSVWFNGRLFGGNPKAKFVWKYHRLSGYILFPFLLLTAHLAGAWSDWMNMKTIYLVRLVVYTIAPLLILLAVLSRVRPSKMKLF